MADVNTTTISPNVCPKCKPGVAIPHASERASPDAEPTTRNPQSAEQRRSASGTTASSLPWKKPSKKSEPA
jgi:hypothetical protein